MSQQLLGSQVLDTAAIESQLAKDQYIHVHIPRLYWVGLLTPLGISIVALIFSASVTAILGLEWVNTGEDNWTLFELGAVIAFPLTLIGAFQLICGLAIFPYSIKFKKPKQ